MNTNIISSICTTIYYIYMHVLNSQRYKLHVLTLPVIGYGVIQAGFPHMRCSSKA